jgi:hypothetical protein
MCSERVPLGRAFLDVVRQNMPAIRAILASTAVDPSVLTSAERRQWGGFQRRKETAEAVLALARKGTPIKEIVRQLGLAPAERDAVVREQRPDGKWRWPSGR